MKKNVVNLIFFLCLFISTQAQIAPQENLYIPPNTDDQFLTNGTVQYTMKMGQYPVNAVGNELVVLVDLN